MIVGWSGGVPKGLTSGGFRRGARICIALFFKLFFEGVFFRCFSISGGFGEGFWNQNGPQNRFLGRFFSMFFLSAFWHRFWVVFWRLETWKIAIFLKENNDFHKIDVFEKTRFLHALWLPKTSQSRSQIPPKSQKIACENKNKSQHASPQFFSNPSTNPELAATHPTPQGKPKRPPKSHPFT